MKQNEKKMFAFAGNFILNYSPKRIDQFWYAI